MKTFSKLLVLVLALALVLSLTACSKQDAGIVGTWKYNLDFKKFTEIAGESGELDSIEELGDSFKQIFDGLNLVIVLDLKSDGTYSFYWDENAARTAVDSMMSRMGEVMPTVFAEIYGMSVEEISALLEANGTTMDDLVAQSLASVDTEEMVSSLSESSSKGTYRYSDGKLYLTEEGYAENPNDYVVVELNGNELKIKEAANDTDLDSLKALLPMVFTK
jgi:hypothetical protein